MKIAVEVGTVADGNVRGAVEYAKAFGLDRIVLTASRVPGFTDTGLLDRSLMKEQVEIVQGAGMTTSTVVYWAPPALIEGGPESGKLFDSLVTNLDVIAAAGLTTLSMFAGISRPVDPNGEAAQWARLIDFYQRLTAAAEQRQVRIASHFAGTAPSRSLLTGAAAYRRLFAEVPGASNGLCFCVGNAWVSDGARMYDVVREFADRIFYVHTRSTLPGWGEYPVWWDHQQGPDMRLFLQTLKEIGYTGDLRSEHMPEVPRENRTDIGTAWAIGYTKALLQYL